MSRAKRGQICVIHTTHTYTMADFSRVTEHRATVGTVRNVSRDGKIKAYRPVTGYGDSAPVVRLDRLTNLEGKYAIESPGFDHGRAIVAIVERGNCEFDTVEAAREFLRPFLERA